MGGSSRLSFHLTEELTTYELNIAFIDTEHNDHREPGRRFRPASDIGQLGRSEADGQSRRESNRTGNMTGLPPKAHLAVWAQRDLQWSGGFDGRWAVVDGTLMGNPGRDGSCRAGQAWR